MSTCIHGLAVVIGAAEAAPTHTVMITSLGAYAANMMMPEDRPGPLTDNPPAFYLKQGERVRVLGKAADSEGKMFVPVSVPGKDGVFWVAEKSGTKLTLASVVAAGLAPKVPTWVWAVGAAGAALLLGFGSFFAARGRK